ncbi:hypothetical protein [Stenotrophomonas maltophilia]|uniref:hypothetical protein n=1 Tax=Stenotrophomonas maltophilia TaxID=40324 RepID=UPI000DA6EC91|nr:hypothetical protein [Stenotrophomonas maltophilia]MCU1200016.1 hypothetical protein [Stenotrophomonas maltophilia]PZS96351.1 hypothetical protein A7X66_09290 [Stenotrophomonas maltophilia]
MSRLDFLTLLVREATDAENSASVRLERVSKAHADLLNELRAEDRRVARVFDAARAVLSASDFTDMLHAEDCLREALAACEPETPHEPV